MINQRTMCTESIGNIEKSKIRHRPTCPDRLLWWHIPSISYLSPYLFSSHWITKSALSTRVKLNTCIGFSYIHWLYIVAYGLWWNKYLFHDTIIIFFTIKGKITQVFFRSTSEQLSIVGYWLKHSPRQLEVFGSEFELWSQIRFPQAFMISDWPTVHCVYDNDHGCVSVSLG